MREKLNFLEEALTTELNFVGVNFKKNSSLANRYQDYLTQVGR